MKLYFSITSPFVRKVMICAVAGGLDKQIRTVPIDPWASPEELLHDNPLSKLPCLVTDDGTALYDSPVICEYLDSIGEGGLFPPPGPARWRALKQQATADGIMDAAILRRVEGNRPPEPARIGVMDRQHAVVTRGLDLLEREPPAEHLDIGTISVACALGYLDFRFSHEAWREGRPKLEKWYAAMQQRPELAQTAPG